MCDLLVARPPHTVAGQRPEVSSAIAQVSLIAPARQATVSVSGDGLRASGWALRVTNQKLPAHSCMVSSWFGLGELIAHPWTLLDGRFRSAS